MQATENIQNAIAQLDATNPNYYTLRNEAEAVFQAELAATYLVAAVPANVADATYGYAYQQGHAGGYADIEIHYVDVAALVNLAATSNK